MHLLASIAAAAFLGLTSAQSSTAVPTGITTASPPQTTEGYFLNDCPNATGAGFALCALTISENIWVSEGPCQGAATKGDDDVFSSCYCRMMVEWAPCYETVCPQSVMARYSSSVSKHECPASVWATITAEVGKDGGASGAVPTGGAGDGGGSGSKNGAVGVAAPALFSVLGLGIGVLAAI